MKVSVRSATVLVALCAVSAPATAQHATPGTVADTFTAPSSSETPYVVPAADGWQTISLISAGDVAEENGYRMAGIPDGLGVMAGKFEDGKYVAEKAYLTVFMNHEITPGGGITRLHGTNGAFVSEWSVHLNSLTVKRGEDLIRDVYTWDAATSQWVFNPTAQFNRFCSADLPAYTAFYNPQTRKGFDGRMFMNGEESGAQGRAFAHVVTGAGKGTSYELPALGRSSWENIVAHPNAGDRTIVAALNDSTPGQVNVFVGQKQATGNPVERAGLASGTLYGIKVTNGGANYANGAVTRENAGPINGTFMLVAANDAGVTKFARPEDGAWDTQNTRAFYFVVTGASVDGAGQSARLYKLTFDSLADLAAGGTIQLIVDRAAIAGPPTFAQFDNITVAGDGSVMVQEDPGNVEYIAKTWQVNPVTKSATAILQSDATRFTAPYVAPFNRDEESSGIIEVTEFVKAANWYEQGRRYFLADIQAHYAIPGELYEGGQLYLVVSPKP